MLSLVGEIDVESVENSRQFKAFYGFCTSGVPIFKLSTSNLVECWETSPKIDVNNNFHQNRILHLF